MKVTIHNVSSDKTCGVHQTLLGIREGKEGWFNLYCPGGIACDDDGQLWGVMVSGGREWQGQRFGTKVGQIGTK